MTEINQNLNSIASSSYYLYSTLLKFLRLMDIISVSVPFSKCSKRSRIVWALPFRASSSLTFEVRLP